MLDRARELMRSGARDAAREMLAQLQEMLENLRAGTQQAQPSPGEQTLSDLQKMIQLQQQSAGTQLSDEQREQRQGQGSSSSRGSRARAARQQGQQQGSRASKGNRASRGRWASLPPSRRRCAGRWAS